jgi:hypothetical protein
LAQKNFTAKYHYSDGLMVGSTIHFKKAGTFSKTSGSCMVSSSTFGKYQIQNDTLYFMHGFNEGLSRLYKIKINVELQNNDSLKLEIDSEFDSLKCSYAGVELLFYDEFDSAMNSISVNAKGKINITVSGRHNFRYQVRFIRKVEKEAISNLNDNELDPSDLVDPFELDSHPLFEKCFVVSHTKQELVLESIDAHGKKIEMKYER